MSGDELLSIWHDVQKTPLLSVDVTSDLIRKESSLTPIDEEADSVTDEEPFITAEEVQVCITHLQKRKARQRNALQK